MRTATIFFVIMVLGIVMPSLAQTISNEVTLADGRVVDITHIFEDGDDPTFKTTDPTGQFYWTLELYCKPYSDSNGNEQQKFTLYDCNFSNNFSILLKEIKWGGYIEYLQTSVYPIKYIDAENRDIYYKGRVSASKSTGERIGSIEVTFNLAPSMPSLSSINYSYEDIRIYPTGFPYLDGIWNVHIKCNRCTCLLIDRTNSHGGHYNSNHLFTLREEVISPKDLAVDIDMTYKMLPGINWGVWATVIAYNSYGTAISSDTVCSTDYITDPEILARIEEWRLQQAGVNEIDSPTNTITFKLHHDHISVGIAPSLIGKAIISDCYGHLTTAIFDNDDIDITQLSPGIYILLIEATDGLNKTFKFIKS